VTGLGIAADAADVTGFDVRDGEDVFLPSICPVDGFTLD